MTPIDIHIRDGSACTCGEPWPCPKAPQVQADALSYPERGRPRKPEDQRRSEKLIVALTPSEEQAMLITAAKAGYRKVQDWARKVLNDATKEEEP